MAYDGELGLQFVTHTSTDYTVPGIVELAQRGHEAGFDQFWITDMLSYRQLFVSMAAVAQAVPITVGSGVFVPYYRNPIDVADALASIAELTAADEVSLGIGRGGVAITGKQVETPRPYRMLAETTQCLEALLAGEEIRFGDYELVADYFNLRPDARITQGYDPPVPVRTYLGGYGETALRTGGRHTDGVLIGGEFLPLVQAGRVEDLFGLARAAAREVDPDKQLRTVGEINVSVADDAATARAYTTTYTAHEMMTWRQTAFSDEEFAAMGIDPTNLDRLEEAFDAGATIEEAAELVTDSMVEAAFVVGDPETVNERLHELLELPAVRRLDQIIFAKLGPDNERAIELLADEVLPSFA